MTIFITGSSGKTASHLANLLTPTHAILIASRRPSPDAKYPTVRFDWLDETTWGLPFAHMQARISPITATYLVSPDLQDAREQVMPFVRFAYLKGVKRFVLLSAWEVGEGDACVMGPTHAALRGMAAREGIEWAVLRPHFFMENFAEPYHSPCIRDEGKIYTAAGKGTVPFISARDIASVAHRMLVDEQSHNTDYVITGGDSLSYAQVADIFSQTLGRKIKHVELSKQELKHKLLEYECPEPQAEYLAELDVRVGNGEGAEPTETVTKLLGREPYTLQQVVSDLRQEWLQLQ
ncbi:Hypothetical predicted protein [Lecanosticta acicola]|uniref:NmrA-like domain-containing protein n=1 Tax=Lecanosticta acicola TaxID=111012 RepID=A0AAI9EC87_9PEZI|nr:Hypothetical predicted protein [Lecanosticta acicola]